MEALNADHPDLPEEAVERLLRAAQREGRTAFITALKDIAPALRQQGAEQVEREAANWRRRAESADRQRSEWQRKEAATRDQIKALQAERDQALKQGAGQERERLWKLLQDSGLIFCADDNGRNAMNIAREAFDQSGDTDA